LRSTLRQSIAFPPFFRRVNAHVCTPAILQPLGRPKCRADARSFYVYWLRIRVINVKQARIMRKIAMGFVRQVARGQ
jgi:hypothetical protein